MIKLLIGASIIVLSLLVGLIVKERKISNDLLFLILTNYILTIAVGIFKLGYQDYYLSLLSSILLIINSALLIWDCRKMKNKYFGYGYFGLIVYLFFILF